MCVENEWECPNPARVVSKLAAARCAGLIQCAWEQRPNPSLKAHQKADPGDFERTLEFIRYALAEGEQYE